MNVVVMVTMLAAVSLQLSSCGKTDQRSNSDSQLPRLQGSAAIIADALLPFSVGEPLPESTESFDRYFRRLGRIELSDSVTIGDIQSVEVSAAGRLLISELATGRIFLLGPDGSSIRQLSSSPCVPGYSWNPTDSKFYADGSILVVDTVGGFRFDPDGNCVGKANLGFGLPKTSNTTGQKGFIALRTDHESYYFEQVDGDGDQLRRINIADAFLNMVTYIPIGGIVSDQRGHVYMAFPYSPLLHVIRSGTETITSIGESPSYYRPLKEDFQGNMREMGNLMKEVRRLMYVSSYSEQLFLLDERKLLLIVRNGYEDVETSSEYFGYQVVSTSGVTLTPDPVTLPAFENQSSVIAARDGLAYRLTEPVPGENGQWSNQGLDVYRFVQRPK